LLSMPFTSATVTPTPHITSLSLHDALPISQREFYSVKAHTPIPANSVDAIEAVLTSGHEVVWDGMLEGVGSPIWRTCRELRTPKDRKSTRLNSSHVKISYAVFCLKKKKPQS